MRNRKLFIGVDEAGYGPNLGPLTLAASVWEIGADVTETEFCVAISKRFRTDSLSKPGGNVPLGDSKKLYDRSKGIKNLESGVLAMTSLLGGAPPRNLGELAEMVGLQTLSPDSPGKGDNLLPPWYEGALQLPVPKSTASPDSIDAMRQLASDELDQHGYRLVGLAATAVTEPVFNRKLVTTGSKGLLLSQATLQLVARAIGDTKLPVECFCDRQGGRKNYMPILLDAMPDAWFIETAQEARRSSYSCQSPKLDIHFSVGGDSFPPTALASMVAKYFRERFMDAFNAYWINLCPGIQPTAGYPVDAKRFANEISEAAKKQGLAPAIWWRDK